jgi:hypothetical protein
VIEQCLSVLRAAVTAVGNQLDEACGWQLRQTRVDRLKTIDATRYADIQHPGDSAADAIFSQAGKAIRSQTELLLGPRAEVRVLLASGQSQSAMRLTTYVNSVQATARIYDGFLLHSAGCAMAKGRLVASRSRPLRGADFA